MCKKEKSRLAFKNSLEQELKILESDLDTSPSPSCLQHYNSTKKELESIEKYETNGFIVRSKIKWIECGEKNSKLFLNLEKRNYENRLISKIKVNNELITDHKEIIKEQRKFYKTLYSEKLDPENETYKNSITTFLDNNNIKTLSNEEKEFCEMPITKSEILKSLKQLHNSKTPGSDGLPADFYKFFWTDIQDLVTDSILYALKTGELSIEQKRGIITLIPKKNKDRLHFKNWRPISLLNTDYKLIAKTLASRLKEVLPSIIDNDQTGYLKDRYIGENIRILEDIIFFTKKNCLPGILLSIDFEKAFNSLNWSFLFKTLERANFGKVFISYIKTLYNDTQTVTSNNGNLCEFFQLQRGVRQGCPMSAYLFIVAIEILTTKLSLDKNIKGIKIGDQEIKLCLVAEDTTCFLNDLKSLDNTLKTIKKTSP